MSEDIRPSSFEEAEAEARALMEAAKVLGRMLDASDEMLEEGTLPGDDKTDDLQARMETARDMCQQVSMAMTLGMIKKGHVPEFADDEESVDEGSRGFM